MITPHRAHPLWFAFLLHRLSGLALALFLPLHFWLLSQALHGQEALDGALAWTELGIVKFAEFGLVFLLAAHFFGGLRLLALELLPLAKTWTDAQKNLAAAAIAVALLISGAFLLQAV